MEELIRIIIEIIAAAMRGSEKRKAPTVPLEEAQRQRALIAQMQALQQQAVGGQRRVQMKPAAARADQARKPSRGVPKPPPLPGRTLVASAPVVAACGGTLQSAAALRERVPLRVPLIMGEILGPPLALREPEF